MKPNNMKGMPRQKAAPGTIGRLIKMLYKSYPVLVPLSVVCIIFSSVASSIPAIFLQKVTAIIEIWQKTGDWKGASAEIFPQISICLL